MELNVGQRYDARALEGRLGGALLVEASQALLYPRAIVVRRLDDAVYFCVMRSIDSRTRKEHVEVHLDCRVRGTVAPDVEIDVLLETGPSTWLYVGPARIGMEGRKGDQLTLRYFLRSVPHELDSLLRPASGVRPIDGLDLARALADGATDRALLAEQLATSWLGPLPDVSPVPIDAWDLRRQNYDHPDEVTPRELDYRDGTTSAAPVDVRRWHALWTKLDTVRDHPWSAWPAVWEHDDEGVAWFQSECQNGSTFGLENGAVLMHGWVLRGRTSTRCARDVAELSLQFVILGLTQGAHAMLLHADAASARSLPLRPVGLEAWPGWFDGPPMEWVGCEGAIGLRSSEGVTLRVTDRGTLLALAARLAPNRR